VSVTPDDLARAYKAITATPAIIRAAYNAIEEVAEFDDETMEEILQDAEVMLEMLDQGDGSLAIGALATLCRRLRYVTAALGLPVATRLRELEDTMIRARDCTVQPPGR